MRRFHIIVDFSYLYYRYFYKLRTDDSVNKKYKYGQGISRLTYMVGEEEVDTTYMYHIGRDIETFRENLYKTQEDRETEVIVSICFDSKSERKEEDDEYKAKRENRLQAEDFQNMRNLMQMFRDIGYNVYKEDGKEADDLVYSLVEKYKDSFDFNVIYTPDKDLMVNICENVGVMRSSTAKSTYDGVYIKNYERYLSEKMKCNVPYNSILLYLSMVGDTIDGIKGVKGFGPKAFDKLINTMRNDGYEFKLLREPQNVEKAIKSYEDAYKGKNGEALQQALRGLEMAKSRLIDVAEPIKNDTMEKRNEVYSKYGIKSLLNKR